jgi:ATP-dependent Clp protease ATP-binding subunit ClpA
MALFQDTNALFHSNGNLRHEVITDQASRVLEKAIFYTQSTNWESVRTPHLFMGLLSAPDQAITQWGNRLGANLQRLLVQFKEIFQVEEMTEAFPILRLNREFLSDNVIRLLHDALQRSRSYGRYRISPMDLLVELFGSPASIVAECFRRIGLSAEQLTELAILAERETEID